MDDLVKRIKHYNSSLTKDTTKMTHYVGVPLTYLGLLTFLGFMHISLFGFLNIHFGWLASIAVVAYFCMSDLEIGLGVAGLLFVLNIVAGFVSQPPSFFGFIVSILFVGGGLGALYYGQQQEGKQPDPKEFLNILMEAPIAMVAELLFMAGMKQDLKKELEKK